MSKPVLRVLSQEDPQGASEPRRNDVPAADVEMTRVLKTAPLRIASDPSGGRITHWIHEPLHDVVAPMRTTSS